eukprot:12802576-Alexandrium_andersonii.AAC.1
MSSAVPGWPQQPWAACCMIVGRAVEPASSSTRHLQPLLEGYPRLWSTQLLLPRQQASREGSYCKQSRGLSQL